MSTSKVIDKENNEEYTEEKSERSSGRYHLLEIEYERCRQEIHDLKRKLALDEAMLREVQEANEIHEHSLDRRISEKEQIIFQTEEKYRAITKEYDNVVSNLETKLAEQMTEIKKLRNEIECLRAMDRCTPQTDVSLRAEDDGSSTTLRNRIDELVVLLQAEKHRSEYAEETIKQLQTRCNELEYISRNMEGQLDERSTALEDARAQLILGRSAAVSLEADPTHELCKGNSLFAEVEDRRQNVLGKMNTLREKYAQAKRTCKAQMAEIKILRAKRVETLERWKNDADRTRWSKNEQLIQKYKDRISDLEGKLKSEIKKSNDTKLNNCADPSFEYFQSLLDAKRKETNELRVKIEDLSTRMLIQEEAETNITKELQYWQYKAVCFEEQTCALRAELGLDRLDNAGRKGLSRTDFEELTSHRKAEVTARETEAISKQLHILQFSHLSPLLNIVSKTEDTTCHPLKSLGECKVMEKTSSEEKANDNGTVESEAIPLNEPCEFKHARNTDRGKDEYFKKMVRFTDISPTEESNDDAQKSTKARHKYPVVYIPVVDSNS